MAAGTIFLILASCGFYIYGGLNIAAIFGSGIVVNYIFALILSRARKGRKAVLSLAVVLNVLMLLYFKYFNFFMSAVNSIIGRDYNARNILLPLGISFFTFQQIMYLVYIYRGNALDPLDYLAFVLYFPKLIMGPLAEPADFLGQLKDPALRKVNWDNIASGLKIFSFGLFKKLLLADTFSRAVAWGFGHTDTMTSMDVILVTLFYTFEIYFDFSGYCDMAVGVSQMINITLPMNFNSPYKAFSIRDFWKR